MPLHACQAWNRAAEPDFEIGQERKCLRSRGQRRKTSFSRSRSRGGPAQGPRTAANRIGSSNPALFFCDIKDLLAEGVGFEPSIRFSIISCKPMNSLMNSKQLKRPGT